MGHTSNPGVSPFSLSNSSLETESVLSRQSAGNGGTSTQLLVDQIVSDFVQNASDWKAVAAMTVGGLAYRAGRAGVSSAMASRGFALAGLPLSVGVGLGAEVSAFEITHRALHSLPGEAGAKSSGSLWSFSGAGGLKEGWVSSFVTFGLLKGFGGLARGQNVLLQHAFQDAGMVLGQQWLAERGIGPKPEGTLAERFLKAEATNLQLGAAMALGHALVPPLGLASMPGDFNIDRPFSDGRKGESFFSEFIPQKKLAWEGFIVMSERDPYAPGGKTNGTGDVPIPSSSTPDPLIGQVIENRYQIEAVIGAGGMGKVYRGISLHLNQAPVAIKVLHANMASPEHVERFRLEARLASSVRNPHIIEVKDVGQLQDGSVYLVMEYLEGSPLSSLVKSKKPVPVPRLVSIARQIAVGLGAAHRQGVVHRDLKPGNIHLVSGEDGKDFVKILDFGIAKALNSTEADLTLSGQLLGTPRYMSPEQASGKPVDARSDVYSFGVLLYKMATGRTPFEGEDIAILMAHQFQAPTPIREINPLPQEVPAALEALIMKCLAKSPADRYASMEEVVAELDRLESRRTTGASVVNVNSAELAETQGASGKSRWTLLLALGGLGGAAAAAALLARERLKFVPPSSPTLPTPSLLPVPVLSASGLFVAPTVSAAPIPLRPVVVSASPSSSSVPLPGPAVKKVELVINPPDAQVFQGSQELKRPFRVEFDKGKAVELEIRHKGFRSRKVQLNDASTDRVSIYLEPIVQTLPPVESPVPRPVPKDDDDEDNQ